MSLQELEKPVTQLQQLPDDGLANFARWFEEFMADEWDRQIESDIAAGKLDATAKRADNHFANSRCTTL